MICQAVQSMLTNEYSSFRGTFLFTFKEFELKTLPIYGELKEMPLILSIRHFLKKILYSRLSNKSTGTIGKKLP